MNHFSGLYLISSHFFSVKSFFDLFSRHHFFWMLEKDPASWQDETLGDKFVLFFKSFLAKIEKKELNNYFIKKQNLLLKIPNHEIAQAHAKLYRINENLVPHLLQVVKRLQNDKGFYPMLDCDSLIEILTTEVALKLVMPDLLALTRRSSLESKKSSKSK